MTRYLIMFLCLSCSLFTLIGNSDAQISYPMIMSLAPNSAQIGQTAELTIQSRYDLSGTRRIWVSGDGVTAEPIHPDVKEGEKITRENVRSIRPGFGIHPKYFREIIGKKFKLDLEKGTPMSFETIK